MGIMSYRLVVMLFIFLLVNSDLFDVMAQGETAKRLLVSMVENDETPLADDQAFPLVRFDVTPVNAFGVPVVGLDSASFYLREDEQVVTRYEMEPFVDSEIAVSIMIVADMGLPVEAEPERLKAAIVALYEQLSQIDESGLVLFSVEEDGTAVNLDSPFPQLDVEREMNFTNDEGALINLINAQSVDDGAGSPVYDALFKGIRLTASQARHERRAVLLISDGVDRNREGTGSGSNYVDATTAVAEAQQLGVPVYTVGWGGAVDGDYLQAVAASTGAVYQPAISLSELQAFLEGILNQLKQNYRFQYSSQLPHDNAIHNLVVGLSEAVEMVVPFRAYYPETPLVNSITAILPPNETVRDLSDLTTVRGSIVLQPEVIARGEVTAVNYYVDDSQVAVAAAQEAPWAFSWNTTQLTPGAHDLLVEVIDNGNPPQVGRYEMTVVVAACSLWCQGELALGFNLMFIVVGLMMVLLGFVVFLRVQGNQPGAEPTLIAPPTPGTPKPVASGSSRSVAPATPILTPLESPMSATIADRPLSGLPPTISQTDVLPMFPDVIAFLIEVGQGEEHRLSAVTTIGRDLHNDIILKEVTVAAAHARIEWMDTHFLLTALAPSYTTTINDKTVLNHPLADGDRIIIGQHHFVFREIG